ncbi:polysaccharide deacetylase family protein [Paraflavitalea speifideaquila]|uniref:polysaccharide deacetylase family protein n=1 Tax=Paraflavitalea speifideaquila TaxID=3076558 RepID=UPI0028EC309F|nr:polysaccharide deacetylase family protein [Paraflavitalea speifideiaquila]
MYHKVCANGTADLLTVPANVLESQLHYLQQEGYQTILLSELVNHIRLGSPLPEKPVLITFDDGYRDNFTTAYPIFEKFGMKTNIFLVPAFLQEAVGKGTMGTSPYLWLEDIEAMDPGLVEYGLHSFDHKSYKTLPNKAVEADLHQCKTALSAMGIPFQPCLAFPYGAYPKKNAMKHLEFQKSLAACNIVAAFRIGNRLNALPLNNPLLIQRLDIQGGNNFKKFTRLLRKGKTLFG